MFSWFRWNNRRRKIREDRKYLEARARRFLKSYLAAEGATKHRYYEAVEGASGSLVLRADAEGIARQVITQIAPNFNIPDPFIPLLARPFDELRGSVTTNTDGMKGKFSLTLD